ncbi:MAG: low molecular weight phosphotyrosine protein phosphatase [Alphaproteobacteria bacterium]|nr:low molecular weight phosphotyrosine protein phosphatase [Alphaproteobacteria bacterium]MCB9794717.1 low molecular weight phosphotyrosine protein phosphatase [Alphaproteobacteria bacterium]
MQPVSVLFICLGNICRSPLAEGVFRAAVAREGLSERFVIDSCGTSAYHAGEPPDPGSVRIARERGLDISGQRSRPLAPEDAERFDYLVCMDASNRRNVLRVAPEEKVFLMRDFEPGGPSTQGVPDPWGGGADGFAEVYEIVARCSSGLLRQIRDDQRLT